MDAFTERLRERWDRIAPTRAFARRNRRRTLSLDSEPETSADSSSTVYSSTRDTLSFTTTATPSHDFWLRSPFSERGAERVRPIYSHDLDTAMGIGADTQWSIPLESFRSATDSFTINFEGLSDLWRRYLSRNFDFDDLAPKSQQCKMSRGFDKMFEGET